MAFARALRPVDGNYTLTEVWFVCLSGAPVTLHKCFPSGGESGTMEGMQPLEASDLQPRGS